MKTHLIIITAFATAVLSGQAQTNFYYHSDFAGTDLDPRLRFAADHPVFTHSVTNDVLVISKAAGLGATDYSGRVHSNFQMTGNFSVSVRLRILAGSPTPGLWVGMGPIGGQGIYVEAGTGLRGYHCHPSVSCFSSALQPGASSDLMLRVRRVGTTVFSEVKQGAAFVTVYTNQYADFGAPAIIQIQNAQYTTPTTASTCTFDDLDVTADGIFGPGSAEPLSGISIVRAVAVCWQSELSRFYQVQYATSLDTNTWFDVGTPRSGTGLPMCAYDTTERDTRRFYRVLPWP